jgi:hypothetical protein
MIGENEMYLLLADLEVMNIGKRLRKGSKIHLLWLERRSRREGNFSSGLNV